jgi:hypothetical protein
MFLIQIHKINIYIYLSNYHIQQNPTAVQLAPNP